MYREPDARDKRPSGVLWVLAVVGAFALVAALAFLALGFFALKQFSTSTGMAGAQHRYLTHTSFNEALAGITLEGPIGPDEAAIVVEKLQEAGQDKRVKGVLFEINSPGGSVVASQEIHDNVLELRNKIPVVAYMREVAASGAYYSSVSASWLVANRGTMVGSIGVIMSSFEATQLIDWLKLKPVTLKTGQLKDSGSGLRPWTTEDKSYLQKLINDTRDQFVADVRTARPMLTDDTIKHMSDGRVVLGTEAAERKLVDSIGTRRDAIKKAAELAGLKTGAETEVIPMEMPEIPGFLAEILRTSLTVVMNQVKHIWTTQSGKSIPDASIPYPELNLSR